MYNREEVTKELIAHGYTKKHLSKLDDAELVALLVEEADKLDEITEDIASESPELVEAVVEENKEPTVIPSRLDEGWTDYVMSLLTDKEKAEGKYPRVQGLRRITAKLIGPILENLTRVVQSPSPENEKRATVVCTVKVADIANDGIHVLAAGASDVYWGNTDAPFRNHPVATAETKAEGRAFKKLLNLDVLTAEEKTEKLEDNMLGENVGMINEPQKIHLENLCGVSKLNVNITKLVNKFYPDCHNINNLKHSDVLELFRTLAAFQQMGVPEELQGFDSSWKHELKV